MGVRMPSWNSVGRTPSLRPAAGSNRKEVEKLMNRRKWAWVGAVVGIAVIVVALMVCRSSIHHGQSSSSDCQVARAMIDYNKSQGRILANAFNPEQGREASISDYQDWANHLQGYAARISLPGIATHAHHLADDANSMVELVKHVRSDASVPADPSAPPPWARAYANLHKQFGNELVALGKVCPVQGAQR
jgi:hypothetical protein